jgi:hypothetical protein
MDERSPLGSVLDQFANVDLYAKHAPTFGFVLRRRPQPIPSISDMFGRLGGTVKTRPVKSARNKVRLPSSVGEYWCAINDQGIQPRG